MDPADPHDTAAVLAGTMRTLTFGGRKAFLSAFARGSGAADAPSETHR